MKKISVFLLLSLIFAFTSCDDKKEISSVSPINWESRTLTNSLSDSLVSGNTYLSIYSQIYSLSEHLTHDLTATVSIRNTNRKDSIYITNASYFNTEGHLIRNYIKKPIYLKPLETVSIVIDEKDKEGGTGANFIFDWKIKPKTHKPFFEGIMISTSGQQGLSFTTEGKNYEN
ncbi:DUF3124 domain-containing protein [Cellulophaga sp. HaHaR_3_176]|uniref:DUF3124 domain-containing protein n=1 Tax=Cellulophaga sp. HaHaR_3_176 TaxID=1942464 RepID=UPI001C1F576F|nr:DUF3124 domain-containing protein [Cellulophaga sp. HaHaR_3_176]QWX83507.1 DUF3124 domain-containing protein [Cellulophaga sp. HaHaR_3_176]